ncbi:ROK family transcriptional regulator [Streptomyces sp. NPDC019937]|uniref:ROK family transcriptional regulator n=1 Tax=Streptomyces sp. NPDC019937 TaxID=3154787 RepID=UPI0033C5FF66
MGAQTTTDPRPIPRLSVAGLRPQNTGGPVHSSLARLIASGIADSRADLVKATGLARSTVTRHLDTMIDAGVVTEGGAVSRPGRGRPPLRLALNPRAGVVAVADVGAHSARLALADLSQNLVSQEEIALDVAQGPEATLDLLTERLRRMLAESAAASTGATPDRPSALVVGLPGPVDARAGTPVRPPIMPGWDGFPVGRTMTERFGCRTFVDNDVNLMALGEARALPEGEAPLLFIKIGTGIGGGLISASGELHRGAEGAAGDIGHLRVPGADDTVCSCGNIGCVEAVASATAMAARLSREDSGLAEHDRPRGAADLARLVRDGHPGAVRVVREAAVTIGEVVALLVHVYNPARIVIGGAIAAASDDLLARIRGVVYRRALPLATRRLSLAQSVLGTSAGVVGGTVVGVEHVLSPEGIGDVLAHSA